MGQRVALLIRNTIEAAVREAAGSTPYRTPLVGFAPAGEEEWSRLRQAVGYPHRRPQDILPSARSVVSFFLPFGPEIVRSNRQAGEVAASWALAYVETNQLISQVYQQVTQALAPFGFSAEGIKATHNFDRVTLTAPWSHKHVAVLAGLGRFGSHHQVITPAGTAGRFGSLVTDAALEPTPFSGEEPCLERRSLECGYCYRHCPSSALTASGLDKERCYQFVLGVSEQYQHLGVADVCGKCSLGPCALAIPQGLS